MSIRSFIPIFCVLALSAGCKEKMCAEQVFGTPLPINEAEAVCDHDGRKMTFKLLNPDNLSGCRALLGSERTGIILWATQPQPLSEPHRLWSTSIRLKPEVPGIDYNCEVIYRK